MSSVWIIERKHPTENEHGWVPIATSMYIRKDFAVDAAKRRTSKYWQYRAVEYTRRPEEGQK